MKTKILLLVCLLMLPSLYAAENMSPRIAQRVFTLLERSDTELNYVLEELKVLADSRGVSSTDRGLIMYERAVLLIQQDQLEQAQLELERTIAGQQGNWLPRLRFLLGQVMLMNGEAEGALDPLRIWSENVEQPLPGELVLLSYAYIQTENFEQASVFLERALEISEQPQNQWFELLAFCYTKTGRSSEAIALMERIIASQPQQARWWRQLASIYLILEDVPAGTAGLVIASTLEDISVDHAKRIAGLFNLLNMPADGATVMEHAFLRTPEIVSYEDQMLLAEFWVLARELDKAINAFKTAADMGHSGEPYLKLGQLYMMWERYEEARQALQASISTYGEKVPSQLYYLLAVVEINLGDLEAADQSLIRLEDDEEYGERAQTLDSYIQTELARP